MNGVVALRVLRLPRDAANSIFRPSSPARRLLSQDGKRGPNVAIGPSLAASRRETRSQEASKGPSALPMLQGQHSQFDA